MRFSIKTKIFNMFVAALVTAVLSIGAYAQGSSAITGSVVDQQGQAIAGANVKLINVEQNSERSTTTDGYGNYSFSAVSPGNYSIEVEAPGFSRTTTTGVQALVDKTTTIAVQLQIGDVSAVVEVSAGGIENIVNKQDASLGNNFVSEQIQNLPTEGRNVVDLLSLQPGVTPDGAVAGGRQDQANITLDGIDVNDQQTGLNLDQDEAFASVLRVTPDSIEEFRVTTTNPDASKGRSAGAQVALVTKSGTNQFHGNLFEYHRNTVTTANSWFNNAAGLERPKLIRNLFGGSIGGPIVKDRLFFFYNYEGMREAKDEGVLNLVPLASLGQGIIKFYDSSGVLRSLDTATINALTDQGAPVVDVNPVATALFASAASRYPANSPLAGDGINTGGFRFNAPLPVKLNTHTAKFDWNVTSDQSHTIGLRLNYQQDLYGRTSAFPDTPGTDRWSHPMGLAASHTWLISSNFTNRFNFGITRLAYSNQGDSSENAITFRDVFSPVNFSRTFSRVNPTYNIADDMTWINGNHTVQFGTNIRLVRNKRTSWGSAYDSGVANFGFYEGSGNSLLEPLDQYLTATYGTIVGDQSIRSAQSSLAAVLGRINQYTARFNFDINGNPVANEPTVREFATEEYDFYVQDSWRIRPNFTLNLGLRYGVSTPVYETQGFEAAPDVALDEYFRLRQENAALGINYTEPIRVELSGKANGRPGMYDWDLNNWQPRISFAWSPNFSSDSWLGKVFGANDAAVLRGGFAMTNDYYGQQLAVAFDASNTLGFTSSYTSPANMFNITDSPAPLYTGPGMQINNLPGVVIPGQLTFPLQAPPNNARRIEASIDRGVKAPTNYSMNLTYGRQMPGKMYFEASYIGRIAKDLLARRDVMTPNNIKDLASGMTWYEAATILEVWRREGRDPATIPNLPFFENMYAPGSLDPIFYGSGYSNTEVVYRATDDYMGGTDWTWMQQLLDTYSGNRYFYQSQYGALDSFGSIANSDYHAAAFSLRQRLSGLTWDLNYTYSHSMDDTSGLQTSGAYGGAFILNPLRQEDNYASSDFDMRHIVNFNGLWQLPIGRGKSFFNDMHPVAEAIFGGWQLASIFRWNSGRPIGTNSKIFDNAGWVTNWNLKSAGVQIRDIEMAINRSGDTVNMFADPQAAYNSFRSPFPGESGDRNQIRYPSYWVIDMGLQKSFTMPWSENHKVSFRWDTFNVTNTPIFIGNANTALGYRPDQGIVPAGFGDFTTTQGSARVMQFALRYDF